MTVEELIKKLSEIEDKKLDVVIDYHGSELDFFLSYDEEQDTFVSLIV